MSKDIKVTKSTKGLNDVLFKEIQSLKNGKSTPQQAREISRMVNTVVNVAKLELEMARFVGDARKDKGALPAIEM